MKKFKTLTSSELFTISGGGGGIIRSILIAPIVPIGFTSWLVKKFIK